MAEDPTTTGETQPLRLADALRALPGGAVTEEWPFEFKWRCNLIFVVADNALTVTLDIGSGPDAKIGVDAYHFSYPPIPLATFDSAETLNSFLAGLRRNYFVGLRDTLAEESAQTLSDVLAFMATAKGFGRDDQASIIEAHVRATEKRLKTALAELPERQKFGTWTKIGLKRAVLGAALRLHSQGVQGRALDLAAVREEMRREYGDAAPQSGEALRKQLDDRDLSWRVLKTEVQRYADLRFGRAGRSENGGEKA